MDLIPENYRAKRALEIALSGGLSIKFIGGKEAEILKDYAKEKGLAAFSFLPCPCGNYGDNSKPCKCSAGEILKHQRAIEAVKTELVVEVKRPTPTGMVEFLKKKHNDITSEGWNLIKAICESKYLNTEETKNLIKVARVIAKMAREAKIEPAHLAEAYQNIIPPKD